MYARFWKRGLDFSLSLIALILLSPLLLLLTVVTAVMMRGNPFFVQKRPGKKGKDGQEKIFRLVKFRTMTEQKGRDGNLLPAEKRLTRYGAMLRKTSLDELPEFVNILKGDMSFVGPRPLLVKYLPLYTEEQRRRHDVRPGLTGNAQVHGRNALSWEEKFLLDLEYVDHISLKTDVSLLAQTVVAVLKRSNVEGGEKSIVEEFKGEQSPAGVD